MSNELKSSFSDLTRTEFQAYASDLLEAYPSSAERQRLQAYMLQTIAQDGAAVVADQAALSEKRFRRMEHQEVLEELVLAHAHDYARADSLFQEQTRTDQQIVDLLKADDAEVYIKNRTLSGSNVLLEGDRTKFCGLGATGTAVGGDLACTCVVNGRIVVSGTHATIEGIHFKHAAEWTDDVAEMPLVSFTGSTNVELVFKNCIFENTGSHADGRFWHGEHSGGGTQRIENCLIKNFTSWMLLDATTASSATPAVKLDSFVMDACKIENCMGSTAVRGKTQDPNGSVSFTNNLVAFGANGQHASFWDCFEAHGAMRLICTGNTVTGAVKTNNRGFLQAWSKSAIPWSVTYKKNTIAGFAACFRCACNAGFYAPNVYHEESSLKSTPAETSNVDYAGSYVYPYNDAAQSYAPENGATFPEPAGSFAGLSNFAHA